MKISASMACLPGLPLPFVGGVALAVQTVGVSQRYVPSCGTEQTSAQLNGSWPHYGRWCGSHTGFMECGAETAGSVGLDAGELDHLGPLLGFLGDQLGEVGSGAGKWFTTEIGHPRLHRGLGEHRVDLTVQSLHDFDRSAPGRANA